MISNNNKCAHTKQTSSYQKEIYAKLGLDIDVYNLPRIFLFKRSILRQ